MISAARPLDAIHGELGATCPAIRDDGVRWSVDPLDGTTNYTRRIPYYCTSVAAFS
ncbi:inositol monophosphatase family protein [Arthrobacter sp. KNU-44]|uniref:inositol monophosphatase family protein n=1 Tax=Arthrobacter sp. KNU-44 TaxID=3450744 RepID=UPI003F43896F